MKQSRLVGDIGGTHARFALADADGGLSALRTVEIREYASLQDALRAYLDALDCPAPRSACIGVAAPIEDDHVRFTNSAWEFSIAELRGFLALDALRIMNDFEAVAHSLPALRVEELVQVGGRAPVEGHPKVVLGPGTGFGVALLVPIDERFHVIATQGGHASIGAADMQEQRLLGEMLGGNGPVTREDLLSGRGLETIHRVVCRLGGSADPPLAAAEISSRALDKGDASCRAALDHFCALLGTAAGDQALACGARGGVYIAGGIVPRLIDFLRRSRFRQRFENHVPMQEYLLPIPVYVITHPLSGLLGAARAKLA